MTLELLPDLLVSPTRRTSQASQTSPTNQTNRTSQPRSVQLPVVFASEIFQPIQANQTVQASRTSRTHQTNPLKRMK